MGLMHLPTRHGPAIAPLIVCALLVPFGCSSGCSSTQQAPVQHTNSPIIRVRLHQGVDQVTLACGVPPKYQVANQPPAILNSPRNAVFPISLSPQGWAAGDALLGGADSELVLQPEHDGSVSVNGTPYRGRFRFRPVAPGKFDVINEVDVDSYLSSVVSREMLPGWHDEAYKAQAIVARTYAIYEKETAGSLRHWDVWSDTRSQVYGGIPSETAQSRKTVGETSGVVVAHVQPDGQPRIFKAYFSSCCGGISQSVTDAFGEPWIEPLSDQNVGVSCRASPRFKWGPVEIKKEDLTKRFREFGKRKKRPEQAMATIDHIRVQAYNRFNRPVRFLVRDVKGNQYSLTAEEFRWAVNTDAPDNSNTILYSSFVKIINDSDRIRFVEGHGWGHGVGMCQWCAQKRAEDGLSHEDIVLSAFQRAVLVRAY
jgi:stage II sporulation protein D